SPLSLDTERFFYGADEVGIDLLERFDLHDPAFGFLCHFYGALLQHLGVFREKLICGLRDFLLKIERLLLPEEADGDDDLVLPQGDRVQDGALDLLHQQLVTTLDQAHLRRGLDAHHARELQVIEFLVEAVQKLVEVLQPLRVHRVPGGFRLGFQLGTSLLPQLRQLQLPGGDIDVQLLEILEVLLVEAVEQRDVLQEGHACCIQVVDYLFDLHAELFIARDETLEGPRQVPQQAAQDAAFPRQAPGIHFLDLQNKTGENIPDIAAVLGPQLGQHVVCKA